MVPPHVVRHGWFLKNMKRKYKRELQSIYELFLSKDTETKDLAISLLWTSEYVKDNEIKPELHLCVTKSEMNKSMMTIGYYTHEQNISRYKNFSDILNDLIHDDVCFVKDELK